MERRTITSIKIIVLEYVMKPPFPPPLPPRLEGTWVIFCWAWWLLRTYYSLLFFVNYRLHLCHPSTLHCLYRYKLQHSHVFEVLVTKCGKHACYTKRRRGRLLAISRSFKFPFVFLFRTDAIEINWKSTP